MIFHKILTNFYEHHSFVSCIEPLKVEEALDDPDWVEAMYEELNNFTRNKVWSLVARPKENHNVIGTKWVFKNKQDEHGQVTHNKARLVAQGFTQIEGLDFGETFAPVPVLSPFVYYLLMTLIMILRYIKWMLRVHF